jgi:DNA-binding HxlR family transcriptional regulator
MSCRARLTRAVDERPPISVAYRLTDAGRALLPALEHISRWADEYLPADHPSRRGLQTGKRAQAPR